MKKVVFFILFGSILSIRQITAQNDTLLFYDFYYDQFKFDKLILYVDQKILNDGSKICTVFTPCNWYELISTIPLEFYIVKKRALICFFNGKEDYSKIKEDYVVNYWNTLKDFFDEEDEFELISWEKRQLKRIKGPGICDPPIFSLIVKNGRIMQETYAKSRLYWENYIQYDFDDDN
ncbi:MAG: hypothetical protein RBT02_09855 [Bacteroidales bacterium]|jgi:hypothetical protein|nr:hypothetical protein [Bacteroidales bacterium]